MLIDTHAHLNDRKFEKDFEGVIKRAKASDVNKIINIGYDLPSSLKAVEQAENHEMLFAAVGVHPHDAKDADETVFEELYNLCRNSRKVVAVGEIGLDYYRNLSSKEVQKKVFVYQINLAKQVNLPIVVHDRDAHGDTLKILKDEPAGRIGGVLHCFSGSWEMAKDCIDMGFYISIAGPVTFSNARRLQEVAKNIPLERLLIETDCPYLTPQPHRGKRNEPAYVIHVAEKIAELKGISYETLADATTKNAEELFGI